MSRRPNLLAGEDLPPEPLQERSLAKRARLKAAGLVLFVLFIYAVRQGRFASHRARMAGVAVIAIIVMLLWLGPGWFAVR